MRNHADDSVQRDRRTFRLLRRTQRTRRSSIPALYTCTKPRGIVRGMNTVTVELILKMTKSEGHHRGKGFGTIPIS